MLGEQSLCQTDPRREFNPAATPAAREVTVITTAAAQ